MVAYKTNPVVELRERLARGIDWLTRGTLDAIKDGLKGKAEPAWSRFCAERLDFVDRAVRAFWMKKDDPFSETCRQITDAIKPYGAAELHGIAAIDLADAFGARPWEDVARAAHERGDERFELAALLNDYVTLPFEDRTLAAAFDRSVRAWERNAYHERSPLLRSKEADDADARLVARIIEIVHGHGYAETALRAVAHWVGQPLLLDDIYLGILRQVTRADLHDRLHATITQAAIDAGWSPPRIARDPQCANPIVAGARQRSRVVNEVGR